MLKKFYISSNIVGVSDSIIFRDIKSICNLGNKKSVNIKVDSKQLKIPIGATLYEFKIRQLKETYLIRSIIKLNDSKYKIQSYIQKNNIKISTPFLDKVSLGNDISIFSLIYGSAITIRCSSFIIKNKLFVFCGQSNAGKSTLIKVAREKFNNINIISDDHLVIDFNEDKFYGIAPVWDKFYNNFVNEHFQSAVELNFIILDGSFYNEIGIWDILPHIVGFNFDNHLNNLIIDKINIINNSKKVKIFLGKRQSYEYNLNLVKNIIGDS